MHLEHNISERGIETDDSKIKVMQEWSTAKSIIEVT